MCQKFEDAGGGDRSESFGLLEEHRHPPSLSRLYLYSTSSSTIHTYIRSHLSTHTIAESPSVASPASITSLLVRAIHPYGACLPIRPIRVIAVNNSGRARRPCGADWNHPRVPSVVVVVARERPALSHGRTPHHTRARFGQDPPRSNQVRSPPQLPTNRQTADARPVAGAEARVQFLSPFFPGEVMFPLDIMTMN